MIKPETTNLAIFWDLENVTPSSADTLFIEGLMDYAEGLGRLLTSFAYAEWSKPTFIRLGPPLAARHFKLVHVPRERKGKNSADMQLVSDALELLQFYQHIDTYILITGDSDFRPLLLSLRKSGKKIHVICDIQTAAQDLLALADDFKDYRDLLPGPDIDSEEEERNDNASKTPEYWFERLVEAVQVLKEKSKSCSFGSVKIRMLLLNPDFNESLLGHKMFSRFVSDAAQKGYVTINQNDDGSRLINVAEKEKESKQDSLRNALDSLRLCLTEMGLGSKGDGFHYFGEIGVALQQKGIDLPAVGFVRLTKFMLMAEKRATIEIKRDSTSFYARLKQPD